MTSYMKLLHRTVCCIYLLFVALSCDTGTNNNSSSFVSDRDSSRKGTYGYDAAFLRKHTRKVLELSANDGASKILLSADYQGRVITSTATGDAGLSFGWLNYDLISAGAKKKQFNPVGGEERFWLGPEGGQYSIYFKQNDSFHINRWQVPAVIDTISYDVVRSNNTEAVFAKKASLTNYSGNVFDINIERKIRILGRASIEHQLKTVIKPDLKFVGYQTENRLQNIGNADW